MYIPQMCFSRPPLLAFILRKISESCVPRIDV